MSFVMQEARTSHLSLEVLSRHRCFDGVMGFYRHNAWATASPMRFSVFTPMQAEKRRVPVLYYLCQLSRSARYRWDEYDSTEIMLKIQDAAARPPMLIDQGTDDQFLETQLYPHLLEQAAKNVGYPLTLRRQPGYDRGYYFISSFIEDHLRHHGRMLNSQQPQGKT
jgi:S-formylglutathione hydrolase FrmB